MAKDPIFQPIDVEIDEVPDVAGTPETESADEPAPEQNFTVTLKEGVLDVTGDVAVAVPGTAELDIADEDGRIVVSPGKSVTVPASVAQNLDGLPYLTVEAAS